MRKKIKKPASEQAIILLVKTLGKFEKEESGAANKSLENSIMNSWTGVFPLKQQFTKNETKPRASSFNEDFENKKY